MLCNQREAGMLEEPKNRRENLIETRTGKLPKPGMDVEQEN